MLTISIWGTSLQKVADEAQILALIKILSASLPDARIVVFIQDDETYKAIVARHNLIITAIRPAHLHKVIGQLSKSDLFIMIGGPFFEEPVQALVCLGLIVLSRLVRCPVIAYSITVFRFRTWWGRLLFGNAFNGMDAIMVREKIGLNILQELGVKAKVLLCADSRFVLEPVGGDKIRVILLNEGVNPDKPYIGLTTRYLHEDVPVWVKTSHSYDDKAVLRANESLASAVAHLSELARVVILPLHPSFNEDALMAKIIQRHMKDPSKLTMLSRRYTSLEIMGIIERSEMLLTCRLGSAVLATVTGTPIVAVAYEPRMKDHMERIHLQTNVFDWKELKVDQLVSKLEAVWFARAEIRNAMKTVARELRELAWNNTDVIGKNLSIPTEAWARRDL